MKQFIREFLDLVDNGSEKARDDYLTSLEKEQLYDIIKYAIDNKSLAWKNRMLLQMVQYSPFSFWACDDQYVIKLWEAASTEIYGDDYLGKEFWRFVEKKEREKALRDCLTIISKKGGRVKAFDNYYAVEEDDIGIITQSISIYDDINDEYLQGEIGLHINLSSVQKKHDDIISERNIAVKQFESDCDALLAEFREYKEEIYRKIKEYAKNSEKTKLRDECCKTVDFFCKQLNELRINAIALEQSNLDSLRNQFYSAMEEIEDQINQEKVSVFADTSIKQLRDKAITIAYAKLEEVKNCVKTEADRLNQLMKISESNRAELSDRLNMIYISQADFENHINEIIAGLKVAPTIAAVNALSNDVENIARKTLADIRGYEI